MRVIVQRQEPSSLLSRKTFTCRNKHKNTLTHAAVPSSHTRVKIAGAILRIIVEQIVTGRRPLSSSPHHHNNHHKHQLWDCGVHSKERKRVRFRLPCDVVAKPIPTVRSPPPTLSNKQILPTLLLKENKTGTCYGYALTHYKHYL